MTIMEEDKAIRNIEEEGGEAQRETSARKAGARENIDRIKVLSEMNKRSQSRK